MLFDNRIAVLDRMGRPHGESTTNSHRTGPLPRAASGATFGATKDARPMSRALGLHPGRYRSKPLFWRATSRAPAPSRAIHLTQTPPHATLDATCNATSHATSMLHDQQRIPAATA